MFLIALKRYLGYNKVNKNFGGKAMNSKAIYWLELCDDDLITATALLKSGRLLHMGFFCHLIAEKALKAIIANMTDDAPPRIHDLNKLAHRCDILDELTDKQLSLLDRLTPLQIEARYPEYKEKIRATLTKQYCEQLLSETEEFLCWIKMRLGA